MFRKSVLAFAAIAAVAAAALVPTAASAHYKGWGGFGFRTGVFLAAPLAYNYNYYNCIRWVQTPYGYYVKKNVCVY